ncbi:unnamed protein product [Amoebophrya sp. A120]|nr:unnamed protein product [Amoebophrya sp. A120]|eukprot:GSA120T00023588001.1
MKSISRMMSFPFSLSALFQLLFTTSLYALVGAYGLQVQKRHSEVTRSVIRNRPKKTTSKKTRGGSGKHANSDSIADAGARQTIQVQDEADADHLHSRVAAPSASLEVAHGTTGEPPHAAPHQPTGHLSEVQDVQFDDVDEDHYNDHDAQDLEEPEQDQQTIDVDVDQAATRLSRHDDPADEQVLSTFIALALGEEAKTAFARTTAKMTAADGDVCFMIIGGIAGAVLLIAGIIVGCWCYFSRENKRKTESMKRKEAKPKQPPPVDAAPAYQKLLDTYKFNEEDARVLSEKLADPNVDGSEEVPQEQVDLIRKYAGGRRGSGEELPEGGGGARTTTSLQQGADAAASPAHVVAAATGDEQVLQAQQVDQDQEQPEVTTATTARASAAEQEQPGTGEQPALRKSSARDVAVAPTGGPVFSSSAAGATTKRTSTSATAPAQPALEVLSTPQNSFSAEGNKLINTIGSIRAFLATQEKIPTKYEVYLQIFRKLFAKTMHEFPELFPDLLEETAVLQLEDAKKNPVARTMDYNVVNSVVRAASMRNRLSLESKQNKSAGSNKGEAALLAEENEKEMNFANNNSSSAALLLSNKQEKRMNLNLAAKRIEAQAQLVADALADANLQAGDALPVEVFAPLQIYGFESTDTLSYARCWVETGTQSPDAAAKRMSLSNGERFASAVATDLVPREVHKLIPSKNLVLHMLKKRLKMNLTGTQQGQTNTSAHKNLDEVLFGLERPNADQHLGLLKPLWTTPAGEEDSNKSKAKKSGDDETKSDGAGGSNNPNGSAVPLAFLHTVEREELSPELLQLLLPFGFQSNDSVQRVQHWIFHGCITPVDDLPPRAHYCATRLMKTLGKDGEREFFNMSVDHGTSSSTSFESPLVGSEQMITQAFFEPQELELRGASHNTDDVQQLIGTGALLENAVQIHKLQDQPAELLFFNQLVQNCGFDPITDNQLGFVREWIWAGSPLIANEVPLRVHRLRKILLENSILDQEKCFVIADVVAHPDKYDPMITLKELLRALEQVKEAKEKPKNSRSSEATFGRTSKASTVSNKSGQTNTNTNTAPFTQNSTEKLAIHGLMSAYGFREEDDILKIRRWVILHCPKNVVQLIPNLSQAAEHLEKNCGLKPRHAVNVANIAANKAIPEEKTLGSVVLEKEDQLGILLDILEPFGFDCDTDTVGNLRAWINYDCPDRLSEVGKLIEKQKERNAVLGIMEVDMAGGPLFMQSVVEKPVIAEQQFWWSWWNRLTKGRASKDLSRTSNKVLDPTSLPERAVLVKHLRSGGVAKPYAKKLADAVTDPTCSMPRTEIIPSTGPEKMGVLQKSFGLHMGDSIAKARSVLFDSLSKNPNGLGQAGSRSKMLEREFGSPVPGALQEKQRDIYKDVLHDAGSTLEYSTVVADALVISKRGGAALDGTKHLPAPLDQGDAIVLSLRLGIDPATDTIASARTKIEAIVKAQETDHEESDDSSRSKNTTSRASAAMATQATEYEDILKSGGGPPHVNKTIMIKSMILQEAKKLGNEVQIVNSSEEETEESELEGVGGGSKKKLQMETHISGRTEGPSRRDVATIGLKMSAPGSVGELHESAPAPLGDPALLAKLFINVGLDPDFALGLSKLLVDPNVSRKRQLNADLSWQDNEVLNAMGFGSVEKKTVGAFRDWVNRATAGAFSTTQLASAKDVDGYAREMLILVGFSPEYAKRLGKQCESKSVTDDAELTPPGGKKTGDLMRFAQLGLLLSPEEAVKQHGSKRKKELRAALDASEQTAAEKHKIKANVKAKGDLFWLKARTRTKNLENERPPSIVKMSMATVKRKTLPADVVLHLLPTVGRIRAFVFDLHELPALAQMAELPLPEHDEALFILQKRGFSAEYAQQLAEQLVEAPVETVPDSDPIPEPRGADRSALEALGLGPTANCGLLRGFLAAAEMPCRMLGMQKAPDEDIVASGGGAGGPAVNNNQGTSIFGTFAGAILGTSTTEQQVQSLPPSQQPLSSFRPSSTHESRHSSTHITGMFGSEALSGAGKKTQTVLITEEQQKQHTASVNLLQEAGAPALQSLYQHTELKEQTASARSMKKAEISHVEVEQILTEDLGATVKYASGLATQILDDTVHPDTQIVTPPPNNFPLSFSKDQAAQQAYDLKGEKECVGKLRTLLHALVQVRRLAQIRIDKNLEISDMSGDEEQQMSPAAAKTSQRKTKASAAFVEDDYPVAAAANAYDAEVATRTTTPFTTDGTAALAEYQQIQYRLPRQDGADLECSRAEVLAILLNMGFTRVYSEVVMRQLLSPMVPESAVLAPVPVWDSQNIFALFPKPINHVGKMRAFVQSWWRAPCAVGDFRGFDDQNPYFLIRIFTTLGLSDVISQHLVQLLRSTYEYQQLQFDNNNAHHQYGGGAGLTVQKSMHVFKPRGMDFHCLKQINALLLQDLHKPDKIRLEQLGFRYLVPIAVRKLCAWVGKFCLAVNFGHKKFSEKMLSKHQNAVSTQGAAILLNQACGLPYNGVAEVVAVWLYQQNATSGEVGGGERKSRVSTRKSKAAGGVAQPSPEVDPVAAEEAQADARMTFSKDAPGQGEEVAGQGETAATSPTRPSTAAAGGAVEPRTSRSSTSRKTSKKSTAGATAPLAAASFAAAQQTQPEGEADTVAIQEGGETATAAARASSARKSKKSQLAQDTERQTGMFAQDDGETVVAPAQEIIEAGAIDHEQAVPVEPTAQTMPPQEITAKPAQLKHDRRSVLRSKSNQKYVSMLKQLLATNRADMDTAAVHPGNVDAFMDSLLLESIPWNAEEAAETVEKLSAIVGQESLLLSPAAGGSFPGQQQQNIKSLLAATLYRNACEKPSFSALDLYVDLLNLAAGGLHKVNNSSPDDVVDQQSLLNNNSTQELVRVQQEKDALHAVLRREKTASVGPHYFVDFSVLVSLLDHKAASPTTLSSKLSSQQPASQATGASTLVSNVTEMEEEKAAESQQKKCKAYAADLARLEEQVLCRPSIGLTFRRFLREEFFGGKNKTALEDLQVFYQFLSDSMPVRYTKLTSLGLPGATTLAAEEAAAGLGTPSAAAAPTSTDLAAAAKVDPRNTLTTKNFSVMPLPGEKLSETMRNTTDNKTSQMLTTGGNTGTTPGANVAGEGEASIVLEEGVGGDEQRGQTTSKTSSKKSVTGGARQSEQVVSGSKKVKVSGTRLTGAAASTSQSKKLSSKIGGLPDPELFGSVAPPPGGDAAATATADGQEQEQEPQQPDYVNDETAALLATGASTGVLAAGEQVDMMSRAGDVPSPTIVDLQNFASRKRTQEFEMERETKTTPKQQRSGAEFTLQALRTRFYAKLEQIWKQLALQMSKISPTSFKSALPKSQYPASLLRQTSFEQRMNNTRNSEFYFLTRRQKCSVAEVAEVLQMKEVEEGSGWATGLYPPVAAPAQQLLVSPEGEAGSIVIQEGGEGGAVVEGAAASVRRTSKKSKGQSVQVQQPPPVLTNDAATSTTGMGPIAQSATGVTAEAKTSRASARNTAARGPASLAFGLAGSPDNEQPGNKISAFASSPGAAAAPVAVAPVSSPALHQARELLFSPQQADNTSSEQSRGSETAINLRNWFAQQEKDLLSSREKTLTWPHLFFIDHLDGNANLIPKDALAPEEKPGNCAACCSFCCIRRARKQKEETRRGVLRTIIDELKYKFDRDQPAQ